MPTTTDTDRRLNIKVSAEDGELLQALCAAHCRNLSGEVSWLIRQAAAQLEEVSS